MKWMRHIYLTMTIAVCSIFMGLYVTGLTKGENLWFCLIPVVMVVYDFLKEVYSRTPHQNAAPPCPHPKVEEEVKLFTFQEFEI